MTVMAECEKCGHKWEIELKPRETIQCPNCKEIFDMWILMNDPQNREFVEWLNSQSREKKNNKKEITIPVSQNDVQTAYYKLKHRIAELEAQIEQLVYLHEEDVNTIKLLNKQIEKMRNFQNCDYQLHVTDCPIFKSGGHISCEKCPHWILQEVKENEYD